jgi:peptide/nickel transport system permease protein
MVRFAVRRILIMIPLLLGVSFISFALMNLIPGSPVTMTERSNPKIRQADIERIRDQLGLNDPWPQRYVEWLRDVIFHLDFGPSFYNRLPVTDRIWAAIPHTLLLTGSALIFSLAVAIPFGIYSAVYHKRAFDRLVNIFSVALYSVPLFWLGILLIILFSVQSKKWDLWWLPTLPSGGIVSARNGGGFSDRLEHLIMPTITLASFQIGVWTAYIRSSMLEALGQDYIRTARSKGVREVRVLYGHAFRNALLTLTTLIGLSIPGLFGGALLIEYIFAWPGMGSLTIEAVGRRDYTMVQATTLLFAFLTMIGNMLADLLYGLIDPRVRVS